MKIIIIDSHAVLYKAFYALPPLINKGNPTGAIYGFLLVFFRLLEDFKPDYIAFTFDYPSPTFRHKKYKPYKAQREKAPPSLYEQINETKKMLQELGFKIFEKRGYEADDVIASIATTCSKKNIESIIVTGDLDILQLVNKKIKAYILQRGIKQAILYDSEKVREKYDGLEPKQLTDFRALRGDASDNIPGVKGIGEKTTIKLLKKHYSLEKIFSQKPLEEKLLKNKEIAFLSKELAKIKNNVIINFNIKECCQNNLDWTKISQKLEERGFKTLAKRIIKKQNLKLF